MEKERGLGWSRGRQREGEQKITSGLITSGSAVL